MLRWPSNGFIQKWVGLVVCLLASAVNGLELGGLSWATVQARPLSAISFSRAPASFTRFAFRVGGVAFATVATGKDGLAITALSYEAGQPDGSRLKITLTDVAGGAHVVSGSIFDWQLVPLARYVQTGGDAAVTLFGELKDESRTENERRAGNMIANYHPALENTLLGLRLLQADMLIIDTNSTDLFKEKGQYILGAGETAPTQAELAANLQRFKNVEDWLARQNENFQSYITGDIGVDVEYSYAGSKLVLSGNPVWFCWRTDKAKAEALRAKAFSAASVDVFVLSRYVSLKGDILERAERIATKGNSSSSESVLTSFKQAENDALRSFGDAVLKKLRGAPANSGKPVLVSASEIEKALASSKPDSLVAIVKGIGNKLSELEQQNSKHLKQWTEDYEAIEIPLQAKLESVPVIQMDDFSKKLSKVILAQGGVNAVVYSTLRTSVQYAALFRRAKHQDPAMYEKFVERLSGLPVRVVQPRDYVMRTPTIYPRGQANKVQ